MFTRSDILGILEGQLKANYLNKCANEFILKGVLKRGEGEVRVLDAFHEYMFERCDEVDFGYIDQIEDDDFGGTREREYQYIEEDMDFEYDEFER